MQFCLIPPPKLVHLAEHFPRGFCLAQWLERHEIYREYYKNFPHFVIMDNGVYEDELVSDDTLVDLAREVKPDLLVIPDIRAGKPSENFDRATKFIDAHLAALPARTNLMYVAQCRPEGKDDLCAAACDIQRMRLRVTHLGLGPIAAVNGMSHLIGTREPDHCKLAFSHAMRGFGITIHMLGVGDYPILYQNMPEVESADSASFCWQQQPLTDGFWPKTGCRRPDNYEYWEDESIYFKANTQKILQG